ncbi:MAG: hypothetical protein MJ200_04855 [Mycoplasmoidaceae bacterium]|nr:hypothetical protein [Mycoplasmoidaceae bacterium]
MGEWKHSRSKYDIDDLYLCIRSDTAYDCLTMTDLQIFYDGNLLDNEYCSIVEVQEDGSKWTKIRIDRWEVPEDFLLANVICGQIKTGTQQTTGATTFTLAFRGWTE